MHSVLSTVIWPFVLLLSILPVSPHCACVRWFSSLFWVLMKHGIFLGVVGLLVYIRLYSSPVCTDSTTGWYSPEFPQKAINKSKFLQAVQHLIICFVCTIWITRIFIVQVCIKSQGWDAEILEILRGSLAEIAAPVGAGEWLRLRNGLLGTYVSVN